MTCFCSENYIFGKFDTFCKRLERIADMVNTMESMSSLGEVKIEGIDSIFIRFQGITATYKKKSYDVLDHRKGEVRLVNNMPSEPSNNSHFQNNPEDSSFS